MEEEIGQTELVCKALMMKRRAPSWDATVSLLTNFDAALSIPEPEPAKESYTGWTRGKLVEGATLVGWAMDERSYLMARWDWLDHYQGLGIRSFSCQVPEHGRLELVGRAPAPFLICDPTSVFQTWDPAQEIAALPTTILRFPHSEKVEEFCLQNNISSYLLVACRLINKCFPGVQDIRVELEQDLEGEDQWIVLRFSIADEMDRVLEMYDRYTNLWVSSVSWPERGKIRLSFDVI
jgi:hypothetical protein